MKKNTRQESSIQTQLLERCGCSASGHWWNITVLNSCTQVDSTYASQLSMHYILGTLHFRLIGNVWNTNVRITAGLQAGRLWLAVLYLALRSWRIDDNEAANFFLWLATIAVAHSLVCSVLQALRHIFLKKEKNPPKELSSLHENIKKHKKQGVYISTWRKKIKKSYSY